MPTYEDYLQTTKQLLERSGLEQEEYTVTLSGKPYLASAEVFSPKYFKDTEIFAKNLPITAGEAFCEIGCGIGAVAIAAAKKGASKVLATDINHTAVKIAKKNVHAYGLSHIIEVRQGDLFQALRQGETFDTGFWNTPFGYIKKRRLSMLERAVYDPCYQNTERFIKLGPKYFRRLLIGFSSTLGRMDLLHRFCRESGLKLELIYQEQSTEILPVSLEILEVKE